jgi:hypothetical protein
MKTPRPTTAAAQSAFALYYESDFDVENPSQPLCFANEHNIRNFRAFKVLWTPAYIIARSVQFPNCTANLDSASIFLCKVLRGTSYARRP